MWQVVQAGAWANCLGSRSRGVWGGQSVVAKAGQALWGGASDTGLGEREESRGEKALEATWELSWCLAMES